MLGRRRAVSLPPLVIRGRTFAWGARTYLMGIVNVTPDSFSGDGLGGDTAAIVRQAHEFAEAGADIVDVGGESTRPGHEPVDEEEEAARVVPAIVAVRDAVDLPISIDTFKPAVARAALAAGADIVNCVWGAVPGIVEAAARACAPLVIMHNRATADDAGDCVREVLDSLAVSAREATAGGVPAHRLIVDPGIGFGKTADHNVEILGRLDEIVDELPFPLLVGTSRKSFIGKITGMPVDRRAFGTAATVALAIACGADIVRVHDVRQMADVVDVADAICRVGAAVGRRATARPEDRAHTTIGRD